MNLLVPRLNHILVKWESFSPFPYKDTDGTWHIGYGHGNTNNHPPYVDESTRINQDDAFKLLIDELSLFYVPQLSAAFKEINFKANDNQFSACLDIVYNRGIGNFKKSKTFDWLKRPNEKDWIAHAAEAMVNSNIDGFTPLNVAPDRLTKIPRVYLGLTCRRIDDASLFQEKNI